MPTTSFTSKIFAKYFIYDQTGNIFQLFRKFHESEYAFLSFLYTVYYCIGNVEEKEREKERGCYRILH